jgi:CO/xanthine dehydrogenase FAD-binding subunit
MKPAPFKYIAASSLAEALSLKAQHGEEARFLAGGQSLIPAMNFRLARPAVLIDINGLTELASIDRSNAQAIRLGALARYRAMEKDAGFLKTCRLFADALPHIAHPQIRNRGTLGGNLCHADPASELPAVAVAMQARMRIKSSRGERELAAADFFVAPLTTDLEAEEMLVEITFPAPSLRSGASFMEVARRRGDFALAGVAAIVSLDEQDRCSGIRLVFCGVGETPLDASTSASSLVGQRCTDKAIANAAADVRRMVAPAGNIHASAEYQRHIAEILTRRAIATACDRIAHAA